MARVCLFHWKPEEARPLLAALRSAGHEVEYKDKMADFRALRQTPPEAIVIDLSRLPSHGRELGIFFRRGRATRHIPLLFVNGDAEKVDRVRALLPDAAYTTALRIKVALRTALANPPANPAKPISPIERWAGRSTAQKLGIAKDARVAVIDPPPDYVRAIGDLPEGASFEEEHHGECKLALWFVYGPAEFQAALPRMRRLAAHARLWILWRKARQDGLNGNVIREGAIAVGLVDYKICSVNETWSAMVFAIKKAGNPVQSK
jgi:CheY-like chemotaxis protein